VIITHHGRARLILQSVESAPADNNSAQASSPAADLSRLKAELSSVLAEMQEGFVALGPDGLVLHMNRVAELYFGVARDDALGRGVKDVFPQIAASTTWDQIARVQKSGGSSEFKICSQAHPTSQVQIRAFPYGQGVGIIFSNVTADDEARADQKWWQAVQAATEADPSSAIVRLNVRGGVISVDRNFCAMTGFTEAQLSGLLLTDIVDTVQRPILARAINACLKGDVSPPMNTRFMTKSGGERRLQLSMSAMVHGQAPEGLYIRILDAEHDQLAA